MSERRIHNRRAGWAYARATIRRVCAISADAEWVHRLQQEANDDGIVTAIEQHDSAALFDWLMAIVSHQGVSDAAADGFMARHGNIGWHDMELALASENPCPKLQGYWAFHGCRYQKSRGSCAEPDHLASCPLPGHVLRNGRLNQLAYSLFLFIRDVAQGDLVGWIDAQLDGEDSLEAARAALIEPLRSVYGLSDKVAGLALASLLIAGGQDRPRWFEIGGSIIVIDTLVHNFLSRTGILKRLGADHAYGPACYQQHGCAEIVGRLSGAIDARRFNPAFPKLFPRLVQRAIWQYCAANGFDVCNGRHINSHARCRNAACALFAACDRLALGAG